DIAEERAARCVVGPDLLLVLERRRRLLRDDHGWLPRVLGTCRRAGHIVRTRYGNGLEAFERRGARKGRGQVRVVEPGPVRPREVSIRVGLGTEGERR